MTRKFKMLDLFSGIGGFSLAAQWAFQNNLEIVSFCEIDKFCQKVLNKNFPGIPIHKNIKTLHGGLFGTIDIITGGFPCQPYSVAGKQKGAKDDRALWPEMFRVIKEAKPRWIVGENVPGIIGMELDKVLSDLESEKYETQAFIIPACAVDAPHQRDRVWIVSNNDSKQRKEKQKRVRRDGPGIDFVANGNGKRNEFANGKQWKFEPGICRVANGIPNRVDRLKSLGNSIVPQVAYQILKAIAIIEGF